MTTPPQPPRAHTPGLLHVYRTKDRGSLMLSAEPQSIANAGNYIAELYGPDAEANAERLARAWNSFGPLVEALKVMLRLHYDEGTATLRGLEATEQAESTLAQAKEKPCQSNHEAAARGGWANCPKCGVDIRPAQQS